MESATKALLIVAAVLIAIVIIAVGVVLIKNASNTTKQADEVGNLLKESTKIASIDARGKMKGLIISKEKFNDFYNNISKYYWDDFTNAVKYDQSKLKDQLVVYSYCSLIQTAYGGTTYYGTHLNTLYYNNNLYRLENETRNQATERIFKTEIPRMLKNNIIIQITNPLDDNERKDKALIAYNKIKNGDFITDTTEISDEIKNEFNSRSLKYGSGIIVHYDDTDYIDMVIIMTVLAPVK